MDRRGIIGSKLNKALEKVVSSDAGFDKPKGIVTGFVAVSDFAENSEIIANLAYALARTGLTICVVDFKVFYPNLFDWLGGVTADKKGDGLIRLLNSERTEVHSVALKTDDENIFLISPSPNDDIEDYFNFSVDNVKRAIMIMKESFDVVLIDIPNNPPLEFCVGALMNCQRGFFVASERVDASRNIQKLMEYALKVTNEIKNFNNIIITHRQGLVYEESALSNIAMSGGATKKETLRVAAKVPLLPATVASALDGKVYLRDGGTFINKAFAREIGKVAAIVMEGGG